jgi:hypothetical protein
VVLNPPLVEEVKLAAVPMTDMLVYPLRLKVSNGRMLLIDWFV